MARKSLKITDNFSGYIAYNSDAYTHFYDQRYLLGDLNNCNNCNRLTSLKYDDDSSSVLCADCKENMKGYY
jgi:hypothetical protein